MSQVMEAEVGDSSVLNRLIPMLAELKRFTGCAIGFKDQGIMVKRDDFLDARREFLASFLNDPFTVLGKFINDHRSWSGRRRHAGR